MNAPIRNPEADHAALKDIVEQAGFEAWQAKDAAMFNLMMAHRHGSRDCLKGARADLARSIAIIDAALAATDPAPEARAMIGGAA